MKTALVGHLDADCFYVSCERVRSSALNRQPVAVLGNQGACCIAKSYEMKAFGVTTGMPIWDAVKLCPQGIFIKRDFRWYETISRQILSAIRDVSPTVEYYSIDEMFFDAGELRPVLEAAISLQRRILDEIGVPVSIGISKSKSLAKLISDTAKPFGCKVLLDESETEAFLSSRPVEDLTGIGNRSRDKLTAHGIKDCWQYAQANRHLIRRLLTIKGEAIWWELHGEAVQPIVTTRPPHKCISRGGSIGAATSDPNKINAWLTRNVERLIEELNYYQMLLRRLSLSVEFKEGGNGRTVIFPDATDSFSVLLMACRAMMREIHHGEAISGMHLWAEKLTYARSKQLNLFFANEESGPVADVKQAINGKIGRFAVRSGETLYIDEIYNDETNDYDICDVHGKMCF